MGRAGKAINRERRVPLKRREVLDPALGEPCLGRPDKEELRKETQPGGLQRGGALGPGVL